MRRLIPLVVALALAGWACSGSDGEPPEADAASSSSTPTSTEPTTVVEADSLTPEPTAVPTSTPTPVAFPAFAAESGLPDIEQLTATDSGGRRPLLEWAAHDGAMYYIVAVFSPSGEIYWGWRTSDTSVPVGGNPQLDEDALGPAVSTGMTWSVIAFDETGDPVATSAIRPISP
jgi:hypothetical protein